MYSKEFRESLNAVEAAREANIALEPARMTAEEKEKLLKQYHPDYRTSEFAVLKDGANSGEEVPHELCEMLQAHSRINPCEIDLEKIDYDVDVLVIGGGGAGASAAIEAHNAGANTMIVTKLRIGDANTMMAEGGIQAADKPNDSPAIHFLDAYGGGHFAAKRELLQKLVCDAPGAIQWLNELGVEFDKAPDGTMITTHGGGTSRKRMHAAKDYSGAEIMRTLRDEVLNLGIPVVDFTSAIELILDENGNAAGAVLLNMETGEKLVARAKTVIIATGGAGRMHYQGFPTSNHYGATADGLVLGYRAGAKLLYADTLQYHPTGAAFPQQIFGQFNISTYSLIYGGLVFAFSYFWVSIMFKPLQISDELKRNGGYIPGVRPGEPTAKFLDYVMTRLTFAGALFLVVIAVLPSILMNLSLIHI